MRGERWGEQNGMPLRKNDWSSQVPGADTVLFIVWPWHEESLQNETKKTLRL